MNTHVPRFAALALCAALPPLTVRAADEKPPASWEEVNRSANVVVYGRPHAGGSIQEFRTVGILDAPNWTIKNVLDDTDHYAQFMPNIVESRILARDPAHHTVIAYAKLSAPMVSPRDYTVSVVDLSHAAAGGAVIYQTEWKIANDKGPAEKSGVVRIKASEGMWLLEPAEGGQKTRATYQLYSDCGGLPAFLVNQATKRQMSQLFEAIAKRARDGQYRKNKPERP